jgi:putative ABC transport system ATP-binding protein
MAETPFIECQQLSRVFDAGGQRFHALRNVNLQIARGELLAIVGASGSGKSTLLHALGGLDRPSSGDVLIDGQALARMSEPALAGLRNRHIGFVFQQFNLLARYDALRNVELPLIYAGLPRAQRRQRAKALLHSLGLAEHSSKKPTQMSGGQQQRVAIARALANQPSLLLADEPTGALDSHTSAEVIQLLVDLNRDQGLTVALVTHDNHIAQRCDRIVRFADGRVVADERPAGRS